LGVDNLKNAHFKRLFESVVLKLPAFGFWWDLPTRFIFIKLRLMKFYLIWPKRACARHCTRWKYYTTSSSQCIWLQGDMWID